MNVKRIRLSFMCAAALVGTAPPGFAQQTQQRVVTFSGTIGGGPEFDIGQNVSNAPYSAEGVTTVTQLLSDGTHIDQTTRTKVFRDTAGRERREQTIVGLGALSPSSDSAVVTIVDPVAKARYTLDLRSHTATRVQAVAIAMRLNDAASRRIELIQRGLITAADAQAANAAAPPPPPPPPGAVSRTAPEPRQSLGTRTIEGVMATGTMTKSTIPAGQIGNDRPIEITDEQWTSTELKVLVLSRHHDPRSGDVEYRLTNIVRVEPPADLFTVPSDFSVVDSPPPPPPAPRKQE